MKINGFPNLNNVEDEGFFGGITDSLLSAWEGLFGLYYDQGPVEVPTATGLLNGFLPILLVSFVVTLIVVPVARWVAVQYGIVDDPDANAGSNGDTNLVPANYRVLFHVERLLPSSVPAPALTAAQVAPHPP